MSDGEKPAMMDTRRTASSRPPAVTPKDVGSAASKYPPRQYAAPRRDNVASERVGSEAAASYRRPAQSKMRIQRPRARGGYDSSCQKAEVAKENAPAGEYGSVQAWGSKKSNMNHLLNFHFESRDHHHSAGYGVSHHGDGRRGFRRTAGCSLPYNKERFLQANCQFVVRDGYDYAVHAVDPDTLVDWDRIEQVRIFGHEVPSCPICLYPPKAAKITRCGHIYCWSCMLHYLSLDDKSWRKCPICYEAVHEKDLKSVTALETHHYVAGQQITMKLMRKPRGSLRVLPAPAAAAAAMDCTTDAPQQFPPSVTDAENTCYAKLLSADTTHIQSIVDVERTELQQLLDEDEATSLESSFVIAAVSSLEARRQKLLLTANDSCQLSSQTSDSLSSSSSSRDAAAVTEAEAELSVEHRAQCDDESTVTDSSGHTLLPKADLCYVSAFDDAEEQRPVNTASDDDASSMLSLETAAAADSDDVTEVRRGMTEVASAPSLLMMSAASVDMLTDALSDVSLTADRPLTGTEPQLDNAFYFYQAADGQHIYMHAVNIRCLVKQYGHLRDCPDTITATVVELESVSMDEELRRRLRYLSHLPLTCEFVMAELDLRPPLISQRVLDTLRDELTKRKVNRQRRARLELRHASRVRRQENRQLGFDPTMRIIRSEFLHTSETGAAVPSTAVEDTSSVPGSVAEDEPPASSSLTTTPAAIAAAAADTAAGGCQEPSTSPTTTLSFAQMLKAGSVKSKLVGSEVWPTRRVSASSSHHNCETAGADDYELQVPSYETAFSDAIQAALDSYDQTTAAAEVQAALPSGGRKKQKNKKKLLFSTSLPPRSG